MEETSEESDYEEISEESEEETLYPHQMSNHEEYFRDLNQQTFARVSKIFETFPPGSMDQFPADITPFQLVQFLNSRKPTSSTPNNHHLVVNSAREEKTYKVPGSKGAQLKSTTSSIECNICGKCISSRSNLTKHRRAIHGLEPPGRNETTALAKSMPVKSPPPKSSGNLRYKCYKCWSLFSHSTMLRRHMATIHPGCPVKITTTIKGHHQIPDKSQGSGEMETLKDKKTGCEFGLFKCSMCDGQYSWRQNLIRHVRKIHPEIDVFSLEIVNMAASKTPAKKINQSLIYTGVQAAEKKEPLKAPEDKPATDKSSAPQELQTATTGGRIKCPVCSFCCETKRGLQNHVKKTHPNLKANIYKQLRKIVFKCHKCSAKLSRPDILRRHLKRVHGIGNQVSKIGQIGFKCHKCSVKLSRSDVLRRHLMRVHGISPAKKYLPGKESCANLKKPSAFKCPQCNIIYKWKRNLNSHVRKAHPAGSGNGAPPRDSLDKSSSVNVGGSRSSFQCYQCGRRFSTNGSLNRHLSHKRCLHAKQEALKKLDLSLDFTCQLCKTQFQDNQHRRARYVLERHLATMHRFHHENAREYQHLRKCDAPDIYFCPFCGSMETTTGAMTSHLRINHRELLGVPKTPIKFSKTNSRAGSHLKSECRELEGVPTSHLRTNHRELLGVPKTAVKFSKTKSRAGGSHLKSKHRDLEGVPKKTGSTARSNCSDNQEKPDKPVIPSNSMQECDRCGRRLSSKWSLERHVLDNACGQAQREEMRKLDAKLDFICQICNKKLIFKYRMSLERHLAKEHRFYHENAREYQTLKGGQAPEVYFCAFCGSKESSREALTMHLRSKHKELIGVPKKVKDPQQPNLKEGCRIQKNN